MLRRHFLVGHPSHPHILITHSYKAKIRVEQKYEKRYVTILVGMVILHLIFNEKNIFFKKHLENMFCRMG